MKKITWLIIAIALIFSVVSLEALASPAKNSVAAGIAPVNINQPDLVTLDKTASTTTTEQVAVPPIKAVKITPVVATTKTTVTKTKPTIVKTVAKTGAVKTTATTLKWDASALKIINNPSAFDRNASIRNAYAKKVESYARRNNITVITAKVINGMRE